MYTLKIHLLDYLVEALESFESVSSTKAAPVEHINELVKHSCRITYRKLSKRMQETVQNMERAVCRAQGTEDGIERSSCRVVEIEKAAASGRKKRISGERRNPFVAREDVNHYRYRMDRFVSRNPIWMDSGWLFRGEELQSLPDCVTECAL